MSEKTAEKSSKKMSMGKMILMGLGGVVGLLVVAGVVFKVFYLTPASPEKICTNMFNLMQKELEAKTKIKMTVEEVQKASKISMDQCVADYKKQEKNMFQGMVRVAKKTKCEANAQTLTEFQGCKNKFYR